MVKVINRHNKTSTIMTRIKILFWVLLLSTAISMNAKEVVVTVNSSNPLSSILSDDELQNSDSIKVYGMLSNQDFLVIQKMTVSYKLRHIDLYNTSNTSIDSNAFEGSPLKSIILPKNCTSIGYLAFAHCSNLTSIELGNKLRSMSNGALRMCSNLKKITFPATLTSVGTQCMDGTPFSDIYCLGSTPASASANAWTCYSYCTLHVPLNAKSSYEYANGWMNFTNIVEEAMATVKTLSVQVIGEGNIYVNEQSVPSYYKFESGSSLEISFVPSYGYSVESVIINDIDVTSELVNDKLVYSEVSEDMNVQVVFNVKKSALSIKSAENGSISLEVENGKNYTFSITPNEGWNIESITFNGTDVTAQLSGNRYTTPVIVEDSELNIVYKKDESSIVKSTEKESKLKVLATKGQITIINSGKPNNMVIYTLSGSQLFSESISTGTKIVTVPMNNIYLIKIGGETFKVSI